MFIPAMGSITALLMIHLLSTVMATPIGTPIENRCLSEGKVAAEGKCYSLLSQGPCAEGEWVVLSSSDSATGSCRPRPCQGQEFTDDLYVEVDGECKAAYGEDVCGGKLGERLFIGPYGKGRCDCDDDWNRGTREDGSTRCYQKNTRGWCGPREVLTGCNTKSSDNPSRKSNKECVFPFTHLGKTHNGCKVGSDVEDEGPWCSTKVDENGVHVRGKGEWGYCSENCPVEGALEAPRQTGSLNVEERLLALSKEKLVCGPSKCDEGWLWWQGSDEIYQCVEIGGQSLDNCGIEFDVEENQLFCEGGFATFSLGKLGTKCGSGKVWSNSKNKCVRALG